MKDHQPTLLELQFQETLSQNEQNIAPEISQKLFHARRQAVLEANEKPRGRIKFWLPAFSCGLTAALLLFLFLPQAELSDLKPPVELLVDDAELLSNQENFDIVQDLDFYDWLASVDHG